MTDTTQVLREAANNAVIRRNKSDDDYAELLAVDSKLLDLIDYAKRAADRLNDTEAADQLRVFAGVLRDAKADELTPAFQMLADTVADADRYSPRLAEVG